VQRPVPEEAQPASIGRDVASDLTGALCAEVNRHRVAPLRHVLLQRLEHAASLADEVSRVLVEREDAVHPAERQHHLVVDRHRAADEARVATLRHDRDATLVAVREDGGDLGGRGRPQRQLRVTAVLSHPVCVVLLECVGVSDSIAGPDDRGEVLHVELRERTALRRAEAASAWHSPHGLAAQHASEGHSVICCTENAPVHTLSISDSYSRFSPLCCSNHSRNDVKTRKENKSAGEVPQPGTPRNPILPTSVPGTDLGCRQPRARCERGSRRRRRQHAAAANALRGLCHEPRREVGGREARRTAQR